MRKSQGIQLTLLASVAAFLSSCGSEKAPRRCVDANNKVVDENYCRDTQHVGGFIPYHYYYGGPRGYVPIGAFMSGGSTTPPRSGYTAAPSATTGTSRGVIGGAGEAAAGSSGGGGHAGGAGE